MGAGKLPEQIIQRVEDGLRAIEEDRRRDPVIERLMAQPIKRAISPEETNRRRTISAKAGQSRLAVARRLRIEHQLKVVRHKINVLRASNPATHTKTIDEQIASLQRYAMRLRAMLPVKAPSKKRSKRSKRSPRTRSKMPRRR